MTPTAAARASQSAQSLRDRPKDPSLLRDRCYIDGAWVGTPVFAVNNPATGAELAKVPQLSADDCTRAVEAAERAFPAWAKLTAKQRFALDLPEKRAFFREGVDLVSTSIDTATHGRVLFRLSRKGLSAPASADTNLH